MDPRDVTRLYTSLYDDYAAATQKSVEQMQAARYARRLAHTLAAEDRGDLYCDHAKVTQVYEELMKKVTAK